MGALRSFGLAVATVAVAAAALLWAALLNGFPLIFPDSGTYLGIAFGREYAVDRSSFYGLFLKPFVILAPGEGGLWLALIAQAVLIATVLAAAVRRIAPDAASWAPAAYLLIVCASTSLPFHAGQFMPDAFTGAVVLLAWLAATRDPGEEGAALLWFGAAALAMTHYTHVVLLLASALTAIAAQAAIGLERRATLMRAGAAASAAASALLVLVAANGLVLDRWSPAPMGPVFQFARLNEDGLITPWLDRHCGRDAPAELCAIRERLPRDSQVLLWNAERSPLYAALWHDADRWRWVDMMAIANRGAVLERPGAFLAHSANGAARQFASFQVLDDECPVGCRDPSGGITFTLTKYRPDAVPALLASRQVRDETYKPLLRALTTPVAALSVLLLPLAGLAAWRRRDSPALSFVGAISATLLANAALAGALSDVHDRYQSRVVWLAPFVLLMLALRWSQTFRR